ncbi:MAG TPA: sulfurtransferase [Tissierellales bacterium]|nr:sulfurtransferase [Tissierellales bacterium]
MKESNRKRLSLIMVLVLVLSLSLIGCSKDAGTNEVKDLNKNVEENIKFEDDTYIVDAEWLKENMEKENLLILDARGQEAYDKGHIPGAIAVMWQQFADIDGTPGEDLNWGTVLEPDTLSQRFSEVGIDEDKEIVVYTNTKKGWGEDGRIVWMLRRSGLDNTKILDGGWDYWKSEGYEVSKEPVEPTSTNFKVKELDSKTNIETEELVNKVDDVVIIDVREKDEYEGATKYGEVRGGHLPGAINIPFNSFLEKNGTIKNPEEIKAILEENGVNKDDEIVTYCTAGIRSAHMQIVLTMLGYDNVQNFDASFHAWAGSPELELE